MELDNFKHIARRITLSPKKKEEIRDALELYIKNFPVTTGEPIRHTDMSQIMSDRLGYLGVLKRILLSPMPVIALILALMLGGGASVAAEQALPGDALYPVKVGVNEKVESWFAISDESQAKLDAKLAERRLEEAEKLAAENKLDEKTRADVEARFTAHADEVNANLAKLNQNEEKRSAALAVSSEFDASLRAHADVLSAILVKNSDNGNAALGLVTAINAQAKTVAQAKASAESNVSADLNVDARIQGSADIRLKEATEKIQEVREILSRPRNADTVVYADAEANIALAEKIVAQGNAYYEAKAYGKALASFQEAWNIAYKTWIVLNGGITYQVSVGSAADINILPALQPNPNEGSKLQAIAEARFQAAVQALNEIRTFVNARMAAMDKETAAKIDAQLSIADSLVLEAKGHIGAKVYDKAISESDAAIIVIKGVYGILGGNPNINPPQGVPAIEPWLRNNTGTKIDANGKLEIKLGQ